MSDVQVQPAAPPVPSVAYADRYEDGRVVVKCSRCQQEVCRHAIPAEAGAQMVEAWSLTNGGCPLAQCQPCRAIVRAAGKRRAGQLCGCGFYHSSSERCGPF